MYDKSQIDDALARDAGAKRGRNKFIAVLFRDTQHGDTCGFMATGLREM
jgi:hypothetical protein